MTEAITSDQVRLEKSEIATADDELINYSERRG